MKISKKDINTFLKMNGIAVEQSLHSKKSSGNIVQQQETHLHIGGYDPGLFRHFSIEALQYLNVLLDKPENKKRIPLTARLVLLLYASDPSRTMKELGEILGCTKGAAQYYVSRYNPRQLTGGEEGEEP